MAVDRRVEAGAEEVLVEGCLEAGGDLGGVAGVFAGGGGGGLHQAGGLGLELDGAVLVEVPVEGVVVVAEGGDEGNHQAAGAAALGGEVGEHIGVFPQKAVVLLVDADGVRQRLRGAVVVGDDGVEVADLAEAVAAQAERVGVAAEGVFADVEVADPVAGGVGVGVRDGHFGEGGAVQYGAQPVAVTVAYLVQDEALAGVEVEP